MGTAENAARAAKALQRAHKAGQGGGGSLWGDLDISQETIVDIVDFNKFPPGVDSFQEKEAWLMAMRAGVPDDSNFAGAFDAAALKLRENYARGNPNTPF